MTWLVLRYWYGYHRSKYFKWNSRKIRFEKKVGQSRYRKRAAKVLRKHEYHRFWFSHYCELMEAYGHQIDCIHFGEGENTIQHNACPYQEDWCMRCDGKIKLMSGRWEHYLTYYDDGFTRRDDHVAEPKLEHWPHTLRTRRT